MSYPEDTDFPPPPSGRTGWPWTDISPQLPNTMPDGSPWARISIVTPSYNQSQFIEETIRSVLLQGYPNLEYIIMDGGSTDNSVEIIRKYEPWLTYWVSKTDRGQTHAINKGLERSTGQICSWLNSDDTLLPGVLPKVIGSMRAESGIRIIFASAYYTDEAGRITGVYRGFPLPAGQRRMTYWRRWAVPQPTLFFERKLLSEYGFLDEDYHFSMDYEWMIRVSQRIMPICIPDVIATYRIHQSSKTGNWQQNKHLFHAECARINNTFAPFPRVAFWTLSVDRLLFTSEHWLLRSLRRIRDWSVQKS